MSLYDELRELLERTQGNRGRATSAVIGTVVPPWMWGAGTAARNQLRPTTNNNWASRDLSDDPMGFRGVSNFFKSLRPATGQMMGQSNPLGGLYEQLLTRLQEPVGVDEDDLMAQIRAQFDPIYNERAQAAQSRTDRGRQEVGDMYSALSQDYRQLAPEAEAQAQEAQAEIEALYGQLRSNIEGHYSRVSEEQANLMKDLGIEAAAPQVLTPQSESATQALNSAAELEAINSQRALDIGQIDESYYTQGAPLAKLTGNNISSDMLFDLNEYLQQLDAERTSGIQQAYTQLLSQAQSQASQMEQQNTGMLWDVLQSQMQAQNQPVEMDANSFLSTLPPQISAEVAQAFTGLQRSPEAVFGRVEDPRHPTPGTFVPTTPEWYMSAADQMLQQGQISQSTHQALMMYLQLRFSGG